ncbi:MAG: hypothetical protein K6F21_04295 [Bacteroidales bacterium]|nr:hypothetical protein [Bacteroidales bacterium]
MRKNNGYNVPEGYFESLRTKLSAIPAQEKQPTRTQKFAPYLALAACFAIAVLVGNFVLNKTTVPAASDDEIIEYLISSDITLAQIEDYLISNQ